MWGALSQEYKGSGKGGRGLTAAHGGGVMDEGGGDMENRRTEERA